MGTSKKELEEMLAKLPRPRAKPGRVEPRQQRRKYGNKIVEYDGHKFHSIRERNRYIGLKAMQERGEIRSLQLQQVFILVESVVINDRKIPPMKYIADFTYFEDGGGFVVEDVKGFKTREYLMKRQMMKAFHGIDIREV